MIEKFCSNPLCVGNFGIFAYPHAIVDDSPDMLGKLTVNVAGNGSQLFIGHNLNLSIVRLRAQLL